MEKTLNLQVAIERLYQAFSMYPLPEYTDPCLHCHTLEEEAKLHSAPLRQLSAVALASYANDALRVWGSVGDFKHFLPRIFELYFSVTEPRFEFLDPEILFSTLRHGEWLTWPMQEQTALRELLHALWDEILADPPPSTSFTDIDCWLCSIAQAEDELEPYLQIWIDDQRMSASLGLSSLLLSSRGRSEFWAERKSQYAQLQSWQKSQAVIAKLEQALALAEGSPAKNEFEAALGSVGFTSP